MQAEHLRALTSLRFFAAAMIVLLHCKLYFSETWTWLTYMPATMVQGVSFFFVLSGFILTHVYLAKPRSYGVFIWTRIARLWPVHLVALLCVMSFVRPDSITFDGPGMFNKWIVLAFNLTLTQSLFPYTAYNFSWNSVSWSISTEMGFYLVFPLLLINIERTWHWKLAGSAGTVAAMWLVAYGLPMEGDIETATAVALLSSFPLARGFEFCLGMAAYVLWRKYMARPIPILAATALEFAVLASALMWLLSWFWYAKSTLAGFPVADQWFGSAGSSWIFALVIVALAGNRGLVSRALSAAPFVWLGEISFAVYMTHLIVLKVLALSIGPEWHREWIVLPAIIAAAAALHHTVEMRARHFLLKLPASLAIDRIVLPADRRAHIE